MRFWSAVLTGLSAVSVVAAEAVISLDPSSFEQFIQTKNGKPVMVEFFAPWCGHCKVLGPKYEEAAQALKKLDIEIAKVDCNAEKEFCQEKKIEGYPTLMIYKDGKGKPFTAGRNAEDIIKTMKQESGQFMEIGTAENIDEYKKQISFILYHDKGDESIVSSLVKAAQGVSNLAYNYVSVTESGVSEADGIKVPTLVGYKTFQDRKQVYAGDLTDIEALEAFIREFAHRDVGEINVTTYSSYMQAGIPLGFIFTTMDKSMDWVDGLAETARKYKGKLSLAVLDSDTFGKHALSLNLEEKFPAFAIHNFAAQTKFPFPQDQKMTVESVIKFVDKYIAGDVEPVFRSEEVPSKEEQAATDVVILVQKTFEELVINTDKHVLVEYYSPDCGHCKNLAPTYEALAAKYKAHPKGGNVVIAKINAVDNDINTSIEGFPTIMMYAAGSKDRPTTYQGNRSAEDIANFISFNEGAVNAYADEDDTPAEEEAKADDSVKASDSKSATDASASEKTKETGKAKVDDSVHDEL